MCDEPVFTKCKIVTKLRRNMRTADRGHVIQKWKMPGNDGQWSSQSYHREVAQNTRIYVVVSCWNRVTTQALAFMTIFAFVLTKRIHGNYRANRRTVDKIASDWVSPISVLRISDKTTVFITTSWWVNIASTNCSSQHSVRCWNGTSRPQTYRPI